MLAFTVLPNNCGAKKMGTLTQKQHIRYVTFYENRERKNAHLFIVE
jgi:hypothetical protein